MKIQFAITLLSAILSISAIAQENESITTEEHSKQNNCRVKEKTDAFTKKITKYIPRVNIGGFSTDPNSISDFMFVIEMYRKESFTNVLFYFPKDVYCVVKNSSHVLFKLENDEIVKITHDRKTSCSKGAYLSGYIKIKEYRKLKKSPIKNIRMVCKNLVLDVGRIKEPNYFINNLKCLED